MSLSENSPVTIGFVGCGGISHAHMGGIAPQKNLKVTACAEIDEERGREWGKRYEVEKVYTDWRAMVEETRPDIVLFATWPNQHIEQVVAAAEMGVPAILCEKALALTAQEGREMAAACEKSRTLLMEAFMYRHGPRTIDYLNRLHRGDIGEIRYGWASFSGGHFGGKGENWRQQKDKGGGIVFDFTCYCVNILRGIMGRAPNRVTALTETCPERDIIITMHAMFDYGGSTAAHIESSMKEHIRMEAMAVGTEGQLDLPMFLMNTGNVDPAPPMRLIQGSPFKGDYNETRIPTTFENPYGLQIKNLADAVRNGVPLGMPLEETIDNLRTTDALLKSAETGRFEEVQS